MYGFDHVVAATRDYPVVLAAALLTSAWAAPPYCHAASGDGEQLHE